MLLTSPKGSSKFPLPITQSHHSRLSSQANLQLNLEGNTPSSLLFSRLGHFDLQVLSYMGQQPLALQPLVSGCIRLLCVSPFFFRGYLLTACLVFLLAASSGHYLSRADPGPDHHLLVAALFSPLFDHISSPCQRKIEHDS